MFHQRGHQRKMEHVHMLQRNIYFSLPKNLKCYRITFKTQGKP